MMNGLDQTTLPHFIISNLYKKSIVLINNDNELPLEAKKEVVQKNWLGNNNKNIVILVSDAEASIIADEHLEILVKLLDACKISLADVAITNFNNAACTYEELKNNLQPQKLILFGVTPAQINLPIVFPEYKLQQYAGCVCFHSVGLQYFLGNDAKTLAEKRKLWTCFKEMFLG